MSWTTFVFAFHLKHSHGYLDIAGRMQVAYNYRFLDNSQSAEKNRFFLESGRVELQGGLFRDFHYKLSFDLKSSALKAKEVWLSYCIASWLSFKMGQFKVPVSKIYAVSSGKWLFISAPRTISSFSPKKDIGLMFSISSPNKLYHFHVGAFTGQGINISLDDRKGSPLVALRVDIQPLGHLKKGNGDMERTAHFSFEFGLNGSYSEDAPEKASLHNVDGSKLLYGGDLTIKFKGLFFLAEVLMATFNTNKEYHTMGFVIEASYYISPLRLEPAIRFDYLDPSDMIEDNTEQTVSFGLNYYPFAKRYFKFMLNYTYHLPKSPSNTRGWQENDLTLMLHLAFK